MLGQTGAVFDLDDDALRARDNLKWATTGADVLPAWVADMDVRVPDVVVRRVRDLLDAGDIGYRVFDAAPDLLLEAFEDRMAQRFGWAPEPGRSRAITDVIQAFQVLVELQTAPGDGVALHVPAYPLFLESLAAAGRRIVPIPMDADADELAGRWRRENVRLVVVVNPHNPSGHMLTADELRPIADAAALSDLTVLSDEIHADLALDGRRHVPFASLGPDVEARTVTVTSASKAFNLAGLHCALAHIGDARVRARLDALPFAFLGGVSSVSRVATIAAWTEGDAWLDDLVARLAENRDTVTRWAGSVGAAVVPAEATYLAWLDFAGTRVEADPAGAFARAGVRLSPGVEFTAHTALESPTFARLNFGTSPERLARILDRMGDALRD
ncbi:MalY/PatB family protein [Aeromicrobium sp. 179-A 4D2 NHS]|uniref:MalY/PatB family protein n=1 Tax=Aeromicrobium sp. 179-A 4D2 NHS TaxID=3142375 RepID=UPI0039A10484